MKRFLKALAALLLVALVGVVALVVSIPIDGWLNRDRVAALTNAQTGGELPVRMHVALPRGEGPFPAVVMIHEFWGLNESILSKAELLAAEGYVVVAPDTLRGTTTQWVPKALWHTISTPDARVIDDLDQVMDYLRARVDVDPERIVVMGFCYGGGKALAYSLARPAAAAGTGVFYGSLTTDVATLARFRGPVLGVFGAMDNLIPLAEVDAFEVALRQAGTPHQVVVFPGVGHAFVTSAEGIAGDAVQAAAWRLFTDWLLLTVAR